MFFIFSKTLDFLLSPLIWLSIIFLWALFTEKSLLKKRLFRWGIGLFFVLSNPFIINLFLLAWEIPPTPLSSFDKNYDIAIVLTGITNNARKTPPDRVYMQEGADRILHALMLYRQGKVKKILITGGTIEVSGKTHTSEAILLAQILAQAQVPKKDIILETSARNTHENAKNTQQLLLAKYPRETLLLITSAFHMRRAKACFEKVGLQVVPFSAGFHTQDLKWELSWLIPTGRALQLWSLLIHEVSGYVIYKMIGYA